MKFIIKRTSACGDEIPCDGAFKMMVERWHTRTCNESEFDRKFSWREGTWRSKGRNHSITKEGYITRQENDVEKYGIEINSIEELLEFSKKNGALVFNAEDYNSSNPMIEIYDTYRE